jgi:hypothetical protein
MKSLFKAFDQKNSGYIEYVEFMKAVIGPLTLPRTQAVGRAYDALDLT